MKLNKRLEVFTGLKVMNSFKVTPHTQEVLGEYLSEFNAEWLQVTYENVGSMSKPKLTKFSFRLEFILRVASSYHTLTLTMESVIFIVDRQFKSKLFFFSRIIRLGIEISG